MNEQRSSDSRSSDSRSSDSRSSEKRFSVFLLVISQVFSMSLWFVSAAILPDMEREFELTAFAKAALSSAVSAGFVIGALTSAVFGIADRFDPRRVFSVASCVAALSGFGLLFTTPGETASLGLRFVTGLMLAGVYPVGMKMIVGWGKSDRGWLVGLLVGALTLGSASPHLVAWIGGAAWRSTVVAVSSLTLSGGLLVLLVKLGPFHAKSPRFQFSALAECWTCKPIRFAYLGYFGHMWELYAMWTWIGAACLVSYQQSMEPQDAVSLAKLTTFATIAAGGVTCLLGGWGADKIGKRRVAIAAMISSGLFGLGVAATLGGSPWLTLWLAVLWGSMIVPDSPQFSAIVADHATPETAGSLLTLQTALGFALTIFTVQAVPVLVELSNWQVALGALAIGPVFGVWFMTRTDSNS